MRMPMRTKWMTRWMLPKMPWAIALALGLSSAPAWGISVPFGSAGETKAADQPIPSIRLTTTKHTDLNSLYAPWAGPRHIRFDEKPPKNVDKKPPKNVDKKPPKNVDEKPPKNVSWPDPSDLPRRGDRKPSPPQELASPMPEPSALLFFGMGLLFARRAIGRQVRG